MTEKLGEFELIRRYFAPLCADVKGAFDLADDAAVIDVPPGQHLVVTTDALIEGIHFLPDDPADSIAAKLLGVNLSDLASMGADPLNYTLTLSLPKEWKNIKINNWLSVFSKELNELQGMFDITLIGGDTVSTSGPLVLTITAFGLVDDDTELRRNGAKIDDTIWLTGTIGDGALGLRVLSGDLKLASISDQDYLADRYRRPQPRVDVGQRLTGKAHAAIDVSDGLAADLHHLCQASEVGADIYLEKIPLSTAAQSAVELNPELLNVILTGGDDYELLFSTDSGKSAAIRAIAESVECDITEIGIVTNNQTIRFLDENKKPVSFKRTGFTHF